MSATRTGLVQPLDLTDVDADRRAAVAIDAITAHGSNWATQHRRPAALTAREALAAVHFEALVLWTAWANVLAGSELTCDDNARIRLAMRRIDTICSEINP